MVRRRRFLLGTGAAIAGAGTIGLGACTGPDFTRQRVAQKYPPIGRMVETELGAVHLWDQGEGPAAVLIHGASGNLRDWTFELGPRIARQFRTVAVDRPGFGYSDRGPQPGWDPAVQARQLRAAVARIGILRPVIVGHSWGAAVALAWAQEAPDSVAGVVAVSGAVMPFSDSKGFAEWTGLDGLAVLAYQRYLRSTADEGGIDRFVTRAFRPQLPPEGYVDYVGGELALRDETLAANTEDLQYLNRALRRMAPAYDQLQVPLEIIHGARDWLLPPGKHAVPLARRAPEARMSILEGVGHMAHHAAPGLVIAAIERLHGREART